MAEAVQLHELDEGATATKTETVKFTNFSKIKINKYHHDAIHISCMLIEEIRRHKS